MSPLPLKVGSRTLTSYSYTNDRNKDLQALDYGNGDRVEYDYDDLGRLISQKYEDGDTVTYSYDNDGALARVYDSATGITTTYYYDLLGRQMKYVESGTNYTHSVGYTYDAENNLAGTVEHINGTDYNTTYTYDEENRVASMTANGTTKAYTYDDLGRITEVVTKQGAQVILTEEYTFNPGTNGSITSQVQTYKVTAGSKSTLYFYEYDEKGNITRVTTEKGAISYAYDAANQLIREDNEHGDYTYVWTYDNAGNILTRKEYAFQTGSLGTLVDTVTYTYGDEDWGDLLTSYDGQNIQYDAMGNPLNDGKWSYEWEHGRQLASMSEVWHPELEITAHPESYTGEAGGTAVFSVAATGDPLSYQWQYSNNGGSAWWSSSMEGSNTASISVQATEARAGNLYRCRISDMNGNTVYSDAAQIDLDGTYPLAILSDPRYYSGNFGETATFAITARGDNITYQWQYSNNGGNAWWNSSITGSATPSMTVQLTEARQNYLYRCKITDAEGNIRYSAAAGFYLPQYTWEFTYDSNGMRTGRTDGLYDFSYVYNGSQLTQMTSYGNTLCFTYDASGKPMTVTLDGTLYYYVTNLQGDVVGILDANGNRVATYIYDAWGNFTVESDDPIGAFNPLTYRGYVYDYETELYYLQSRYYDPQMGRFINGDGLVATGQGFTGNNIFAYCLNNPIIFSDFAGTYSQTWQVWAVLFGDHNPGYIHRAVQAHIVFKYSMQNELTIPGAGRADIYNPATHELWEIKHGGSTDERKSERILSAGLQASRYANGSKTVFEVPYHKGRAGAFNGQFCLDCYDITYLVVYDTPQTGVILYYVLPLENRKAPSFALYPSTEYNYTYAMKPRDILAIGIGIGAGMAVASIFGAGSTNRGLQPYFKY